MRDSLLLPTGSMAVAASPAFSFAGLFFRHLPAWGEADDTQQDGGWRTGHICASDGPSPWQEYWGESSGPELKRWMLTPVFSMLEAEGKIGYLVIDVGCGAVPVTGLLSATPARKRILVDIASDNAESAEALGIRLDAEEAGRREGLGCRKALLRACAFLAINPRTVPYTELADTIVFSEILNYVDFPEGHSGVLCLSKTGQKDHCRQPSVQGERFVVLRNGPQGESPALRISGGARFRYAVQGVSEAAAQETDESEEFIILVAKKPPIHPHSWTGPKSPEVKSKT